MIEARLMSPKGARLYDMRAETFQRLARIASGEAGLHLPAAKSAMLKTRIWPRLRLLNIQDFDDYAALIESQNGAEERREFISALTTNISYFFRENRHFDHLGSVVATDLLKKAEKQQPIRIWSAGCAHGQEPISAAITLLEAGLDFEKHDIKILATDIDPYVIKYCRNGRYAQNMLRGLSKAHLSNYFPKSGSSYDLCNKIRSKITFNELNLLDKWPMSGMFDVIFYRNVLIHLEIEHQNSLWHRFRAVMKNDATLYIGHSERIDVNYSQMFKTVAATTYSTGETVENWQQTPRKGRNGT